MSMSEKSDKGKISKAVFFTGGCATPRKGVVAMIKYILRIIFFIIVFLLAFTIKVK